MLLNSGFYPDISARRQKTLAVGLIRVFETLPAAGFFHAGGDRKAKISSGDGPMMIVAILSEP